MSTTIFNSIWVDILKSDQTVPPINVCKMFLLSSKMFWFVKKSFRSQEMIGSPRNLCEIFLTKLINLWLAKKSL